MVIMKKILSIMVLSLLWCNISLAADGVASLKCDEISGTSKGIGFAIDLNDRTIDWGWGYDISKITNEYKNFYFFLHK